MGVEKINKIVVFGGSAGSVILLFDILKILSPGFNIPLIIVIHRPAGHKSEMRQVFQSQTPIPIIEPTGITPIENGKIYLAPAGKHLIVEPEKFLNIDDSPLVQFARPSIDVLFMSAAECFKRKLIGILVTGTNEDGALGMKMIHENGGMTIVQDPADAKLTRMPLAALRVTKIDMVLNTSEIISYLNQFVKTGAGGTMGKIWEPK